MPGFVGRLALGGKRMGNEKAAIYHDFFAEKEDLPFFRRLMLRLGGPVLDLGCGIGAIAIDLAGAGLDVVAIDNSSYMLEVARSKWEKLVPSVKERIEFVEEDMRDFPYPRQFASAIAARGSFAYLLSTADQLDCLANLRKLLATGGKILLDLFPPSLDLLRGGTDFERSVAADGETTLVRITYTRCDLNRQRCRSTITYQQYKGGILVEQVLAESVTSLLFPRETLLLLRQSGFTVEEVFGDTTGGSFNGDSRRLIVVAGKE